MIGDHAVGGDGGAGYASNTPAELAALHVAVSDADDVADQVLDAVQADAVADLHVVGVRQQRPQATTLRFVFVRAADAGHFQRLDAIAFHEVFDLRHSGLRLIVRLRVVKSDHRDPAAVSHAAVGIFERPVHDVVVCHNMADFCRCILRKLQLHIAVADHSVKDRRQVTDDAPRMRAFLDIHVTGVTAILRAVGVRHQLIAAPCDAVHRPFVQE